MRELHGRLLCGTCSGAECLFSTPGSAVDRLTRHPPTGQETEGHDAPAPLLSTPEGGVHKITPPWSQSLYCPSQLSRVPPRPLKALGYRDGPKPARGGQTAGRSCSGFLPVKGLELSFNCPQVTHTHTHTHSHPGELNYHTKFSH